MDELGDDYTEDEIRLVRIKFISEWQIDASLIVLIIKKAGRQRCLSGFSYVFIAYSCLGKNIPLYLHKP